MEGVKPLFIPELVKSDAGLILTYVGQGGGETSDRAVFWDREL